MRVNNKKESYSLLYKGALGNRLRIWNSPQEIAADNYKGTISMRYKSQGGGFFAYNISIEKISSVKEEWLKNGAKEELIVYNESAPDHLLLIQGELMRTDDHLYFFYSTDKEKMNYALRNGRHAVGLKALFLIKILMDPSSYDDIMALLELFPDSIVEFSVYSCCLGNIPHRNTVVWEVRNY